MKTNLMAAMTALKKKNEPIIIKGKMANTTTQPTPQMSYGPQSVNTSWTQRNQIYNINLEQVQKKLKALRKSLGWTQRELAAASGYSQGTIVRAEKNGWISLRCLFGLINAMGTQITIK